jgi:prolyl-tRNA synthetase
MKEAYVNIFNELGLNYRVVKADAGNIGGDISEEFHILADSGEDLLAISDESDFAANVEILDFDKDPSELEGKPSPDGQGKLQLKRGIEVGHIFQLGQKYSEKMDVKLKNEQGDEVTLSMGCYGIGISRIVAAAIEQNYQEMGMLWPKKITPFQLNIICLDPKKPEVIDASLSLYKLMKKYKIDVVLDDREIRAGIKFSENELLGIPYSVVISPNNFNSNKYEFNDRVLGQKNECTADEIKKIIESNI